MLSATLIDKPCHGASSVFLLMSREVARPYFCSLDMVDGPSSGNVFAHSSLSHALLKWMACYAPFLLYVCLCKFMCVHTHVCHMQVEAKGQAQA